METTTIHPAEAYLRNEQNSTSLYVRIAGQRRRLFINRNENVIGIIAPRKRKSGYIFTDWASIEKIYYPSSSPEDAADIGKKQVLKQTVYKIHSLVLFLIDNLGIHLCHFHIGMAEQLRDSI